MTNDWGRNFGAKNTFFTFAYLTRWGVFAITKISKSGNVPRKNQVTHHSLLCGYRCLVTMTPSDCTTITTREHGDIANDALVLSDITCTQDMVATSYWCSTCVVLTTRYFPHGVNCMSSTSPPTATLRRAAPLQLKSCTMPFSPSTAEPTTAKTEADRESATAQNPLAGTHTTASPVLTSHRRTLQRQVFVIHRDAVFAL